MASEYRVVRYGWPELDRWRVMSAGSNEARARAEYEAISETMKRGGVALIRIENGVRELVQETWVPTGRKRVRSRAIQSAKELLDLLS